MNVGEWEELLLDATQRVRQRVSALALSEGTRNLGVGAAGDTTMLADRAAEEELLRAFAPLADVRVLSEEAGAVGSSDGRVLAVVDPLDGSSNYSRGIPFYCTSVALVDGDSFEGVFLGVVRDLVTGDVYVGKKGEGATKNGMKIRTSSVSDPSEAVVGVDLSRSPRRLAEGLAPLVSGVKRQLHLGANALEMCYVAEGKLDSFVDLRGRIRVIDFCASYLIAVEAGGCVTGPTGEAISPTFDLQQRHSVVASGNKSLHSSILRLCGDACGKGA